jgi:regulator of RNase E activity RraB
MPIKVRNVVINQVLNDGTDVDAFFTSVEHGQATSMNSLKIITDSMKTNPEITKVPYLDTEPRGIFGLKALAYELMKEE